MKVEFEYELNREWIYDEEEEIVGETNFVVSAEWLKELFNKAYKDGYNSFDDFLDCYEPEVDGEYIYREAIKDKALKEDLGIVMY